ncbi:MAG: L,D-transpeptidase family protein [Thermoanaerobaculia bacterium]|nr:L,D-transpeptidase family protein [Thermoanaerobaculia bacterium]
MLSNSSTTLGLPTLLTFCWLTLAGCDQRPVGNTMAFDATVVRVLDQLEAPDLRQRLEGSWREVQLAEAASRGRWRPDPKVEVLWASTMAEARACWLEGERRHHQLQEEWSQARQRAEDLRARAAGLGPDVLEASFVSLQRSADIAWNRALRRLSADDLVGAIQAADETTVSLEQLVAVWESSNSRFFRSDLRRHWAGIEQLAMEDSRRAGAALVVDKYQRRLHVWEDGKKTGSYAIELGQRGLERKLVAGDRATPEGRYRVSAVKGEGNTRYFRALLLDYPNDEDRQRLAAAVRSGIVPLGSSAGSLIEIHGHGGRGMDWTDGCIALSDQDMEALWSVAAEGLSVSIVGVLP